MTQRRLGLALGGGAARGLAHIGVLQALSEAGIKIDMLTGTSAGAIVGALYAGGLSAGQIARIAERTTWAHLVRLTVPRRGLVDTARLEEYLNSLLRGKSFAQLDLPFACIATDLITGDEIELTEGNVAAAVRASAAVPGIMVPMEQGGRLLVDGGVVNNVPIGLARRLGADVVVAVDVNAGAILESNPKSIVQIILQSMEIMQRKALRDEIVHADVWLEPGTGYYSGIELDRAAEIIARGREVTFAQIERIKGLLAGEDTVSN